MHTNLIRPCVGIGSPQELYDNQITSRGLVDDSGRRLNYFTTRNTPKRADELVNGGSVYWIVKGAIIMRQTILDIQTMQDDGGKNFCCIIKDPEIMLVQPMPFRAMQGWRYFPPEKAPADLYPFDPDAEPEDEIDPQMAKELAEAGLL